MDPDKAYETMMDGFAPRAERAQAARDLLSWIDRGGFGPLNVTVAQVERECRNVIEWDDYRFTIDTWEGADED